MKDNRWSVEQARKYNYYCNYFRRMYPELPQEAIERNAVKMVKRLNRV